MTQRRRPRAPQSPSRPRRTRGTLGGLWEAASPPESLSSVAVSLRKMFSQSPDLPLTAYQRETLDGFVRASAEREEDASSTSFLQTKSRHQGPYGAYDVQIGGVS